MQTRIYIGILSARQANARWVKLGCTLLTTLLASPDGQRFLGSEDDLLKQITRSFAQLDPVGFLMISVRQRLTQRRPEVQWYSRVGSYILEEAGLGDSYLRVPRDARHA